MSSASPFVPTLQPTEASAVAGDPKRRRMTEDMEEAPVIEQNTAVDLPSGAPTAPEVSLDPSSPPLPASVLQELLTVIAGLQLSVSTLTTRLGHIETQLTSETPRFASTEPPVRRAAQCQEEEEAPTPAGSSTGPQASSSKSGSQFVSDTPPSIDAWSGQRLPPPPPDLPHLAQLLQQPEAVVLNWLCL